ncbi:MAG: LemA family protein, partial [Flexistipes sinusarabici]
MIAGIIIIVLILIAILLLIYYYNKFISLRNQADESFSG